MEGERTELRKLREEYSISKEASQHVHAAIGELLCSDLSEEWAVELDMLRGVAAACESSLSRITEKATQLKQQEEQEVASG